MNRGYLLAFKTPLGRSILRKVTYPVLVGETLFFTGPDGMRSSCNYRDVIKLEGHELQVNGHAIWLEKIRVTELQPTPA